MHVANRTTMRSRVVSALTQEIVQKADPDDFLLASEHALCRRFHVSRVTVRLALAELENRGLIFRKHGKGTFAFGRSKQEAKSIGVFCRSKAAFSSWSVSEFLRGLHAAQGSYLTSSLLLSTPPYDWPSHLAKNLGGLIVLPNQLDSRELRFLAGQGIPTLVVDDADADGSSISLGIAQAARITTERLLLAGHEKFAFLVGSDAPWTEQMRLGVHQALCSVGINTAFVHEIVAGEENSARLEAVRTLFRQCPAPTAVVATDDSLAALVLFYARQSKNICVPAELSIASLCQLPYFNHLDPQLATVEFPFFEAGQYAAKALDEVRTTGEMASGKEFSPVHRAGETIFSAALRRVL